MMSRSYQQHAERRMRDGQIVRFRPHNGERRYIYHRGGRYWMLVVDETGDGIEKRVEHPVGMYRRKCLFDEYHVEIVGENDVPGPVAALSRAAPPE